MKTISFILFFLLFLEIATKTNLRSLKEETTYTPTSENVKITGRYYQKDGTTWLIHSGSAIQFYATSIDSLTINLVGDNGIYSDENFRPRYGIFINDEIFLDSTMDVLEKSINVIEKFTEKSTIKVMLLSENMNGGIGIKDIIAVSSNLKSITPVEKKNLTIEFIGDSITCAYGVEGKSQSESFKTLTENFSKSYAYLAAKKLDADYSTVCYSGHGIVSGYTSSGEKNPDNLIGDYYTKLSRFADYPGDWDFENHLNDVVFINLGTNDLNYVTKDKDTRSDEFIQEYANFLETVRKYNPDSYIICTFGVMGGGDDLYPLITKAIELLSDEKISSFQSAAQDMNNDGLGSDWHPSEITQKKNGYIVADKICKAIGRESDQVGLNVVANSVYNVTFNKENGANVWWYEGWERMLSIGAQARGKNSEDIIGKITGIELLKNGVYVLEFDFTTDVDIDFPIVLRGKKEYFKDSFSAEKGAQKKHYKGEISVDESDNNAEIDFEIGGGDGGFNVAFNGIKMFKIK